MKPAFHVFDSIYRPKKAHFGLKPSAWLQDVVCDIVPGNGKRCLDLGCGHGRNAIYLAQQGFDVRAVDSSRKAVEFLDSLASEGGLRVQAVCSDIMSISIEPEGFDLILVVTVMGCLENSYIERLAGQLVRALRPGGTLAVEEFSPLDPGASGADGASEFAHLVKNYFSEKDLLFMFRELKTISCRRLWVKDNSHCTAHRHNIARYVGKKRVR